MGKISDALEKSKKAKIVPASKIERPRVTARNRSPERGIPFDEDGILLEKPKEAKIVSASKIERPKVTARDRSPERSIPFDRDGILLEKPKEAKIVSASKIEGPKVAAKEGSPKRHIPFNKGDLLYDYNKIDRKLISFLTPQSYEAEQFKMLKTSILFPDSGEAPRSIMVTSAVPGEGKSFVTANLAISIAQNIEEHVLIIDCDLRNPCVHKQFGFGSVTGLSEYLSNGVPLDSLFMKTKVDKLSILAGGKSPQNPSELLSSRQMSNLLEEVKNRYGNRYIIIDSPPPILTAESSVIARQVDGIILVVKHRNTRREVVEDLLKIIGKEKILGVVLNRSDLRISGYYGYGKYGKYHKYYGK